MATKGTGSCLLIRALQDVLECGEKLIWLDTFGEYQTRAMDLYKNLAFISKDSTLSKISNKT